MLSPPPPRSIEPPYGSRYDCKTVTSVSVHPLSSPLKMRTVLDVSNMPNGLKLRSKCLFCVRTRCPTFFDGYLILDFVFCIVLFIISLEVIVCPVITQRGKYVNEPAAKVHRRASLSSVLLHGC